jgi:hypothetical protein
MGHPKGELCMASHGVTFLGFLPFSFITEGVDKLWKFPIFVAVTIHVVIKVNKRLI